MQLAPLTAPIAASQRPEDAARIAALRGKAQDLEAAFLAEMLSYAGLGAAEGEFSGGIGEEQFASFLRDAQAKAMVEKGGIGLAENLFKSLVRTENADK